MSVELIRLKSGAIAMRHRESGEVMHAGTGPEVEPLEVYVNPSRLEARLREGPVVLLDVGLGAGSNALAAWRVSERIGGLEIVSFENDLSPLALAVEDGFGMDDASRTAAAAVLEKHEFDTPRTKWRLCFGDALEALSAFPAGQADIIFWDLYSQATNRQSWSVAAFRAARLAARDGATLHTFSTATPVRAAMLAAGWAVGAGASTGRKSETTVAATSASLLDSPLGARWLQRLARTTASLDASIDLEALRRAPQFKV